jgi:DNA-binding MarR family transcriptional regulator
MVEVASPAAPDADLIDTIVTELQASIREMRCGSTERLVRRNLSMTNIHVLWLLEHHGAMPMSRLAELLDVSVSNATGLIDRMEERGLVERFRVPDDRRVVLVRPAAGGKLALEETEIVRREQMRDILRRLPAEKLERVLAAFRDVRLAIESDPTAGIRHHHHHFVDSAD